MFAISSPQLFLSFFSVIKFFINKLTSSFDQTLMKDCLCATSHNNIRCCNRNLCHLQIMSRFSFDLLCVFTWVMVGVKKKNDTETWKIRRVAKCVYWTHQQNVQWRANSSDLNAALCSDAAHGTCSYLCNNMTLHLLPRWTFRGVLSFKSIVEFTLAHLFCNITFCLHYFVFILH